MAASLSLQCHPFLSFPTKRLHTQVKCFLPLRAEAWKGKTTQTMLKSLAVLRRPVVGSPSLEENEVKIDEEEEEEEEVKLEEVKLEEVKLEEVNLEEVKETEVRGEREMPDECNWEDTILEDTVPLVGFVRMILHSGKYENDNRLSPEHEVAILAKLLPYHPEYEKKIGCGVDYIKVGLHPQFGKSRCLFIVRTDGEVEDFSFWKCIKGLIRKKYPLYADTFIQNHFYKKRE
ncbi:protein DCL [Carex littledalei]|uniref:Protein DCL n=1 Tax=Carex littledalei TaxID=544730 RepID=A0A833UZ04_9POAL|nr:protein DCL [Carex littledalei]